MASNLDKRDIEFARSICKLAKINTKLDHLTQEAGSQEIVTSLPFASDDADTVMEQFDDERLACILFDAVDRAKEEKIEGEAEERAMTAQASRGIGKQPRRVAFTPAAPVVDESNEALMKAGRKFRMYLQSRYPLTWKRLLLDATV